MPELTPAEKVVIDVFKEAGIHGKLFPSAEACIKHLEEIRPRLGINCPGYGHVIADEPCSWHRDAGDPVCRGCHPTKFKAKAVGVAYHTRKRFQGVDWDEKLSRRYRCKYCGGEFVGRTTHGITWQVSDYCEGSADDLVEIEE